LSPFLGDKEKALGNGLNRINAPHKYDQQRRQREEEIDRERPLLGPVGAVNMSAMPPGDGAV